MAKKEVHINRRPGKFDLPESHPDYGSDNHDEGVVSPNVFGLAAVVEPITNSEDDKHQKEKVALAAKLHLDVTKYFEGKDLGPAKWNELLLAKGELVFTKDKVDELGVEKLNGAIRKLQELFDNLKNEIEMSKKVDDFIIPSDEVTMPVDDLKVNKVDLQEKFNTEFSGLNQAVIRSLLTRVAGRANGRLSIFNANENARFRRIFGKNVGEINIEEWKILKELLSVRSVEITKDVEAEKSSASQMVSGTPPADDEAIVESVKATETPESSGNSIVENNTAEGPASEPEQPISDINRFVKKVDDIFLDEISDDETKKKVLREMALILGRGNYETGIREIDSFKLRFHQVKRIISRPEDILDKSEYLRELEGIFSELINAQNEAEAHVRAGTSYAEVSRSNVSGGVFTRGSEKVFGLVEKGGKILKGGPELVKKKLTERPFEEKYKERLSKGDLGRLDKVFANIASRPLWQKVAISGMLVAPVVVGVSTFAAPSILGVFATRIGLSTMYGYRMGRAQSLINSGTKKEAAKAGVTAASVSLLFSLLLVPRFLQYTGLDTKIQAAVGYAMNNIPTTSAMANTPNGTMPASGKIVEKSPSRLDIGDLWKSAQDWWNGDKIASASEPSNPTNPKAPLLVDTKKIQMEFSYASSKKDEFRVLLDKSHRQVAKSTLSIQQKATLELKLKDVEQRYTSLVKAIQEQDAKMDVDKSGPIQKALSELNKEYESLQIFAQQTENGTMNGQGNTDGSRISQAVPPAPKAEAPVSIDGTEMPIPQTEPSQSATQSAPNQPTVATQPLEQPTTTAKEASPSLPEVTGDVSRKVTVPEIPGRSKLNPGLVEYTKDSFTIKGKIEATQEIWHAYLFDKNPEFKKLNPIQKIRVLEAVDAEIRKKMNGNFRIRGLAQKVLGTGDFRLVQDGLKVNNVSMQNMMKSVFGSELTDPATIKKLAGIRR